MKYTESTIIERPINEVASLFDNRENLYKWMEGLQSIDQLEGEPGEKGSKSLMKFTNGGRDMEMIETILENNLPSRMVVTYDAKGMSNIIFSSLEKIDENKTNYISKQEFKMYGFMKVVAFLAPGVFKKQTRKILSSFKQFAESN